MSLDLHDERVKLTPEAYCVLCAESKLTGETKSAIIRRVMHEMYALPAIHKAKLIQHNLENEGLTGKPGNRT